MGSITLAYVICVAGIILCAVLLTHLKTEKRNRKEKQNREERLAILNEWVENGQKMKTWLDGHFADLMNQNPSVTIGHPEFQALLWKDFDLYQKSLIFYPDIQEDQTLMEGRAFFEKLITTSGRPS